MAVASLFVVAPTASVGCSSSSSPVSNSDAGQPLTDGSSSTPGVDDAAGNDDAGGACGHTIVCSDFASSGEGLGGTYTAGSAGTVLPANFPPAPPGATLCGSVVYATGGTSMAGVLYYVYTGTASSLTSYYQASLASAGDSLGATTSAKNPSRPCDTFADIGGANVGSGAQLYTYGLADGFELGPFPQP